MTQGTNPGAGEKQDSCRTQLRKERRWRSGARTLLFLWWGSVAAWAQQSSGTPPSPRVVLVERPQVVQQFSVDDRAVRSMFNDALLALTRQSSPASAWQSLGITPKDVVGIKISTIGGPLLSSHRALVDAIAQGLVAAGVAPQNIIIWDKFEDEMQRANWAPRPTGPDEPKILSVIPGEGFDPKIFYLNEIIGRLIWGDSEFVGKRPTKEDLIRAAEAVVAQKEDPDAVPTKKPVEDQTSNRSYYTKIITQRCTKIINIPVLADSDTVGLSGCLSSLALGSVDNTRRFQGDGGGNWGELAIPEILDKDFMRKKIVLHVLDSLVANFAGGPKFNPQFTQSAGAIYVSADPVAVDTLALKRVEAWRATAQVPALKLQAIHVKSAGDYNLGQADIKKIDLQTIP